jgi:hypothetical protein
MSWKTIKEEIPECGRLIVGCINGTIDICKVTSQPKGLTVYSLNGIFLPTDIDKIEYWWYVPEIPNNFKMNNYF